MLKFVKVLILNCLILFRMYTTVHIFDMREAFLFHGIRNCVRCTKISLLVVLDGACCRNFHHVQESPTFHYLSELINMAVDDVTRHLMSLQCSKNACLVQFQGCG